MTEKESRVLQTVRRIFFVKKTSGRYPVHALSTEVCKEAGLGPREVADAAILLESAGLIKTGRTLNYTYYEIRNLPGNEQEMNRMFERAIKAFLDDKAEKDPAFAEKYRSEKKNITDCCKFIIAEVKKSCKGNEAACTDEYVYGLAMHYYDEENIKVPANAPSCRVVVPGDIELSEEDKKEAREEAMRRLKEQEVQEQIRKERQKQEAAEKKAETERKRKEERLEKQRKAYEGSGLLFNFDGEDQA